ncbi:hypothetical protein ACFPM3_29255 [Streptomyces coeruleoprunus]|uniref:Uncharacterized protein n=1 Tax=Streptomyces coeruleoprunus TaxID=285563 RepID=A0ABV9XRW5_9ACTN
MTERWCPIPSHDADPVLFRSDRTFRVWQYGVGHSQLLLRAGPEPLELLFEGVHALQLITRYEGIEIRLAEHEEAERMLDYAGLKAPWRERRLPLALHSATGTGFVVCARAKALRGEDREVIWSSRP